MFGTLSNRYTEDGTLGEGRETVWGTAPVSKMKQPVVKPPKVNTWTDRRIKKAADDWLANERFEQETMGDEPDQVAGWTDEQIKFENEVTVGRKGTRYRDKHQHNKKKSQGAKATMEANRWEHTLQDSV